MWSDFVRCNVNYDKGRGDRRRRLGDHRLGSDGDFWAEAAVKAAGSGFGLVVIDHGGL
jgi:hypothetical protein